MILTVFMANGGETKLESEYNWTETTIWFNIYLILMLNFYWRACLAYSKTATYSFHTLEASR
jgi:hypothetical protein